MAGAGSSQALIIAALALLFIYYFAFPRSGSWSKRPHDLGTYDADFEEPFLVSVVRFPFKILKLPLSISAYLFELCANGVAWVFTAGTRAAGLTIIILGFLCSLTIVGICVGLPLIFFGSFLLFLVS